MSIFRKLTGALNSEKNVKIGKSVSCSNLNKNDQKLQQNIVPSLEEFIATKRKSGELRKHIPIQQRKSRLSKTTKEVLHDPPALAYFIQYLEARDAVQLVKFWLDVESFRSSSANIISSNLVSSSNPPPNKTDLEHVGAAQVTDKLDSAEENEEISFTETDEDHKVEKSSILENPEKDVSRAEVLVKTRTEDAVKIYRRYIAPDCARPLHLPTEVNKDIVEMICAESGDVFADCFNNAQDKVVDILENEYFPDFLKSEYHAKHLVDIVTGGQVVIADILYNDTALSHFMEFMETQSRRSLMEFWLTATNFNQSSRTDSAQSDAMVLYEKYFSMQASSPLGFDDDVRLHVENNICSVGGPNHSCFDLALEITLQYLETNYLQRFLLSSMFKNYIKELIGTITASPRSLSSISASRGASCASSSLSRESDDHHDDRSDCSSEVSVQSHHNNNLMSSPLRTHNTLLAMSSPDKMSDAGNNNEISVNSPECSNPDLLWRRTPVRNEIGRVSSIGRYESGWDLAPDTSREQGTQQTRSRISKAVKKLVSNEEQEKMKEEMAWQVAEMFVKEVTSVTMSEEHQNTGVSALTKSFSEGFSLVDNNLDLENMELASAKYF